MADPAAESRSLPVDTKTALARRLGLRYADQRLRIEEDHETQVFGHGINFFHPENWYSSASLIRSTLRLCGLYRRGLRNAARVELRRNDVTLGNLPGAFDGFTILHISDMHVDMNDGAMQSLIRLVAPIDYDICVLTGDYRGTTWGPFAATIEGLARVRSYLHDPIYGVLGNHDTIRMLPDLERLGIRMLINECETLDRGSEHIHLAGIDDAHFFRAENINKAASAIPERGVSILLSHSPEIYRQAAAAGFDLLLAGHTHGGQICLPGSIPITLDSVLPRRMGSGAWRYNGMAGYTSAGVGSSILPVRFNCPPSITLHTLRYGPPSIGLLSQSH
ncbi:MAG: metallophosphoesterase [Alphaproteobacteria bacterium]|nr:metallophosphoesterase [Alphaproteobacteria bacterium]